MRGLHDSRILAGVGGDNEDSVVVRFPEGKALVQTVDFFTPIVNDPFRFGQVAAANALSDVYAMGGEPWSAMNIVCFPVKSMPGEILARVLEGGADKVREAGAVLAGGHSVEDDELKFGLAVSGIVDPDKIATNRGVKPGDELLLTKPIGTGVLATAVKAEWQGCDELEELLYRWASRLNSNAGRVIRELGLRGATDVTGFGLGGHATELARASRVTLELKLDAIPFLEEAIELAGMGLMPAGSICNRNHFMEKTRLANNVDPILRDLTFDAQTSGGLLLAVPPEHLKRAQQLLEADGDLAAHVGTAVDKQSETDLVVV